MFIFSAKITKKRIVLAVLAAAVVLCGLILLAGWLSGRDAVHLKSEEDRLSYIGSLGYTPAGPAENSQTLLIPEHFDDTYNNYNLLQREAGFDLTKYAGQSAVIYTYLLLDYPTGEENVQLHLILWEDRLIGGDICSPKLDGFIHGLKSAQSPEAAG